MHFCSRLSDRSIGVKVIMMNSNPFACPQFLPVLSIADIAVEPALIVAPHPDDECLGCGGAIALLRSHQYQVQILVMSDGTKSHPNSINYPAPRLKQLRETETLAAMAQLDVATSCITFMQMPDGAIPNAESAGFETSVSECQHYLISVNPKIIFVPYRYDPHPDHRATWEILQTALQRSGLSPRWLEYPIWDWDPTQRQNHTSSGIKTWCLDISEVVELKQQSIAFYRSQTSSLIDDDPGGFRLTSEMLNKLCQPLEIYFEMEQ